MEPNVPDETHPQQGSLPDRADGMANFTKVAKLLHRIAADELERYEHAKIFPFPFYIDEKFLRALRDEILESLNRVPVKDPPEFKSKTRFQDISTIRFDSFERFLDKAGNKKDPESAVLSWSKFALDQAGEPIAGEVRVEFITEKRLQTQDAAPGDFNYAVIKMAVSGSDQDWVERTFSDLSPYVESVKLGGIYRPLWLFRNKWFLQVTGYTLGWIGFFVGIHFAKNLFRKGLRITEAEILQNILSTKNIGTKVDLFAKQLLSPDKTPWWEPILVISTGALTFAFVFIGCMALLPKLTPNSSIAVGLSGRRAQSYINTFKFLVFTLLLCSVLVPLLIEIVKRFL